MSWTSPRTWVSLEKVTAALLNTHLRDNLLTLVNYAGASNGDSRTFTSSSYADLDALTGGSGTIAAVSVSVTTGTTALVVVTAGNLSNSGGITLLSYRVSGASTIASSDVESSIRNGATTNMGASGVFFEDGLTPGTNVFELQARVTAGTGTLAFPKLAVIPLPG